MRRRNIKNYKIPLDYSLPKAILDILLDFSQDFPLFDTPYIRIKKAWREIRDIPPPSKWRYNRAIAYLKKRKKLKLVEKNNKMFLKMTRKGKVEALMQRLCQDFKKTVIWDGKWRLIIWDIPEKTSPERDKIRRLVKSLEFYQLQESVYITPYPLPQSAVDYLRESKLLYYIRFLRVDKIDNDRFLKRHFGLK